MIDLVHKKKRVIQSFDNYAQLYQYSNERERLSYSAGVLNSVWNLWNLFWREYWIAHVKGGINVNGIPLNPIYCQYNSKQSVHFLLYKLGKRRKHNFGDTISSIRQEPTWGDIRNVEKLANELIPDHTHLSYLLGIIGYYKIYIQHFQEIRNCFIHLNNENVSSLKSIRPYYIYNSSQEILDILETKAIVNQIRCFDNLIDNMRGMIINL